MIKQLLQMTTGVLGVVMSVAVMAAGSSPIGQWRTIDDNTGAARSVVSIYEENGVLFGKIVEVLDETAESTCSKCKGELKDAPIIGLVFLSGMEQDGEEWSGGRILDPDNGKVYKSKMELKDDGAKLEVRGYIGIAAVGRSQTWERVE